MMPLGRSRTTAAGSTLVRANESPGRRLDTRAASVAQALLVHTDIAEEVSYTAAHERAHAVSNVALGKTHEQGSAPPWPRDGHAAASVRCTRRAVNAQANFVTRHKAVFLHVQEEGRLLLLLARRAFEESELQRTRRKNGRYQSAPARSVRVSTGRKQITTYVPGDPRANR